MGGLTLDTRSEGVETAPDGTCDRCLTPDVPRFRWYETIVLMSRTEPTVLGWALCKDCHPQKGLDKGLDNVEQKV